MFILAMKAPMTRDRYKTGVAKFFDFICIERGKILVEKAKAFSNRA
jgi:hypothetical protein